MRAISSMQTNISKTRFDAVVFDLDGTLANTFPTVLRIFNRLMLDRTGREWKLAELAPYFGTPETVMIERIFSDHHNLDNHEAVIADFYRLCHEDGHEIQPFDGMRDLVHGLRQAGVKLGVYSGANTESARIRIGHAGLLEYFDEIIGGDAVSNYKPHPEGLVKLIEQFDVDPGRTVYIGDMVADVEAGRGAGATTVAVTWGAGKREALAAAKPDFLVERPELLRGIIG